MNKGVEILLARMESNPEEFAIRMNYGESQWSGLINTFKHCLDQEDIDALEAGAKRCNQEMFTRKVMEALLDPKEESEGQERFRVNSNGGLSLTTLGGQAQWANTTGQVTLPSGSITLGNTTLSEAGLKQMLATHKAMREETKPKTLFGKLYNYLGSNK